MYDFLYKILNFNLLVGFRFFLLFVGGFMGGGFVVGIFGGFGGFGEFGGLVVFGLLGFFIVFIGFIDFCGFLGFFRFKIYIDMRMFMRYNMGSFKVFISKNG